MSNFGAKLAKFWLKNGHTVIHYVSMGGQVVSVALIIKASTKLPDVMKDHDERINKLLEGKDRNSLSPEMKKLCRGEYRVTLKKLAKLYALPFGIFLASLAGMEVSHQMMRKELASLAAAYGALALSYQRYRENTESLLEANGIDMKKLRRDMEANIRKEIAEGRLDSKQLKNMEFDFPGTSPYSFIFNDECPDWTLDRDTNLAVLASKVSRAQCLLDNRGYLFLNELREFIGLEPVKIGYRAGWIQTPDKTTYIDLQIDEVDEALFEGDPTAIERNNDNPWVTCEPNINTYDVLTANPNDFGIHHDIIPDGIPAVAIKEED